ncbi:AAA family ATPase [Desulfoluna spongiiphila]|uniref:MoxR-like ATPase n=1 Tax=Desulfoluna spongiiphila TaxID=419481 RepID=A0A1G5BTH2_9BACT|nr:MoxR family ATPase [Desulfoluna spongiiphila]SCX93499.1 MoxR-like ATPase [Desulfoluna spongiiphila]VVS93905.1 atpase aaa-3 [Desulfoluna spongiiphila]
MKKAFDDIITAMSQVVFGKTHEVKLAITCLFAGGHLLIEDRPGIGKTTLAKALSRCLGLGFTRMQYTSDMLPGDLLGVSIFDQTSGSFVFHKGPVFTQVLLADEINRATPKSQSALLEAMEEWQVTVEGKSYPLAKPFFVIATQNPLEQSGTFPLPESQLDRFLMRISVGYPDRKAERELLEKGNRKHTIESIQPVLDTHRVMDIRRNIAAIHVSGAFLDYVQDLLDFTRNAPHFTHGLSPRAGLAFLHATRSWACIHGRDHVIPEDLQAVFPYIAGHRLQSRDTRAEYSFQQLRDLLMEVPVP